MLRRFFPLLVVLSLGVLPLSHAGCGDLANAKPCSSADDCLTPQACCNAGSAVTAEGSGPICVLPEPYTKDYGSIDGCNAFMPHLVEGNPCGRGTPDARGLDGCRQGLICCAATLTCVKDGSCPASPPARSGPSSRAGCSSDDECGAPEICCGITYEKRDGTCTHPLDCGTGGPLPDGTGGQAGAGGQAPTLTLAEQICAAAACPSSSNTSTARARCKDRFDQNLFAPSDACLSAVQNTRSLCASFYGFDASRPGGEDQPPFLPASCLSNGGPGSAFAADVQQLCARLDSCGLLSSYFTDAAACRAALTGLRYESIHRLLVLPGCPTAADLPSRVPAAGDACYNPPFDCYGLNSCGCNGADCPSLNNPAVCGP